MTSIAQAASQHRHTVLVDLAHALVVGMAHTRQRFRDMAALAGEPHHVTQTAWISGELPDLLVLARLSAAVGWRLTVRLGSADMATLLHPRADVAQVHVVRHLHPALGIVAHLAAIDPRWRTAWREPLPSQTPVVPSWPQPSAALVRATAVDTIMRYRHACAHAWLVYAAHHHLTLAGLATVCGVSRATFLDQLTTRGPTLQRIGSYAAALHLRVQVCYTQLHEPVPPQQIIATPADIDALRIQARTSLAVLERMDPTIAAHATPPSDASVRRAYTHGASQAAVAQQLRVSVPWLQEQLRRLGMVRPVTPRLPELVRRERAGAIVRAVQAGTTYAAVGQRFGVSRQRVQQIVRAHGHAVRRIP